MRLRWLLLVTVLSGVVYNVVEGNEALKRAIERDFRTFFDTGRFGRILRNIIKDLDLKKSLVEPFEKRHWPRVKSEAFCTICTIGVNEILRAENSTLVFDRATELCVELGFGTPYVCENLVQSNENELMYIIQNTPDETGNDICGMIFVGEGCVSDNPDRIWEITLPDVQKPPVTETPYPEPGVPTLKILHLADTHYDPDYLPGGSIACKELYLCCRYEEENQELNNTAGFWGTYGDCDIPFWTLEAMYDHIAETHPDIDFIIWTGDIVPHDVWNTSRASNLEVLHEMADLIVKYFPGIPVYPSTGNHESNPVNQFPQPYITEPEFEISWLYDELNAIWQTWLPPEAAQSVTYSAYYSVQVKPGLKLLSLNTNFCYGYNWWLIHDSTDIANELQLMAQELQSSEDIGEKVYIIGHIPSGHGDCSLTWSHEFNKIVSRYESTISAIFYGHTHDDHFMLYFDPSDPSRVYKTAYIAQSQTTYSDTNPGYKIYTIEGEYNGSEFRVLDHENWILDLEIANALNRTTFYKLYSAKEEYSLPDLSPQSWYDLVLEMNEPDSVLFEDFYRNYVKASPVKLSDGCDEECKSKLLCKLLVSDNSDHSKCEELNLVINQ